MWKEGGDVGDGSQQQRAALGAFVRRQRDDHVVLVPHVEGIVGEWMWGRMAGSPQLGVVVLVFVLVTRWTQ